MARSAEDLALLLNVMAGFDERDAIAHAVTRRIAPGDAERVPWHDMASHGAFVLLAGGLGLLAGYLFQLR